MALKSPGRIGCCYKALKPIISGPIQEDLDIERPESLHYSITTLNSCYNPKDIERRKIYSTPFI